MIVPIAPLAAQTAPKKPITNAAADVPPLESCCRFVMNVITPSGAIGSSSSLTLSNRSKTPSAPIRNATAGKNASSELYAICWERPMQSSRKKALKLPFSAASHSPRLSRSGELGVRPTRARRCSVAVDKAETPGLGLRLAFASAPEDQPRGRADPTCQQKTDAERADRRRRQVRPQLRAHVRRLAEALAQRLGGVGELIALGLDLAAHV